MDERENIQTWLNAATRGIRFGPDRRAAAAELRAHLEDKAGDLGRIFPDMTAEEAEARALDEMGDPAEIGSALARIHKPWLGYLWRASQCVLGTAAAAALVVGLNTTLTGDRLGGWFERREGLDMTPGNCIALEPSPERARVDGCTVSMGRAAVYMSGGAEKQLGVTVRVTSPYFWIREGRWHQFVSAVDSLGNYYFTEYERFQENSASSWRYVHGSLDGYSPFYKDYILWVEELDPAAEWIRLEYDWLGRQLAMTVELKGAEE